MKLRRSGILIKIVIVALLLAATITLVDRYAQIDVARAAKQELSDDIDTLIAANQHTQYLIDNSDSDEVIADVARGELGYVLPGENIYYGD